MKYRKNGLILPKILGFSSGFDLDICKKFIDALEVSLIVKRTNIFIKMYYFSKASAK